MSISIKSNTLSAYQRDIAKELHKLCSPCIPYRISKSSNNHLQIWIDDCPMITTSSTPSDFRAKRSAIAEIRRALRDRKARLEAECAKSEEMQNELEESVESMMVSMTKNKSDATIKILDQACSYISKHIEKLREKEMETVLEENDIDAINLYRSKKAREILEHSMSNIKGVTFEVAETKSMVASTLSHLRFHLPTKATYAEVIKPKEEPKKVSESKPELKVVETPVVIEEQPKIKGSSEESQLNLITSLLGTRRSERVDMLRCLSEKDAQNLIEDIQSALKKNRDTRINKITELMREGNITLEDIQLAMEPKRKK